jgi:hypothetical protein
MKMKNIKIHLIKACLFIPCFLVAFVSAQELPLVDFKSLVKSENSNVVSIKVIAGNPSQMEIVVSPHQEAAVIFSSGENGWDVRAYRYAAVDIENTGKEIIVPEMRLKSSNGFDDWGTYAMGHTVIKPGESKILLVPIFDSEFRSQHPYVEKYFPGMTLFPDLWEFSFWRIVKARAINGVKISLLNQKPEKSYAYKIRNIRMVLPLKFPTEAELKSGSFFPFINKYGQYNKNTWPDKVKSDSDFQKFQSTEKIFLSKNSQVQGWDIYGGMGNGSTLKATGHFRVEKLKGKWWFVDPAGKLFWSKGSTGIGPTLAPTTLTSQQKLTYFEITPSTNNPLTSPFLLIQEKKPPVYQIGAANLFLKYGTNWEAQAMDITLKRQNAFGMNTIGAWSDKAIAVQRDPAFKGKKIPYTMILHLWSTMLADKMPDAFDPNFESNIEGQIAKSAEQGHDQDPYCLGYYGSVEKSRGNIYFLLQP